MNAKRIDFDMVTIDEDKETAAFSNQYGAVVWRLRDVIEIRPGYAWVVRFLHEQKLREEAEA